jgi:biotin operon repressor
MPLSPKQKIKHLKACQEALDTVERLGGESAAAEYLGVPYQTIQSRIRAAKRFKLKTKVKPLPEPTVERDIGASIAKLLRKGASAKDMAASLNASHDAVLDAIAMLKHNGVSVQQHGDTYTIAPPVSSHVHGTQFEFVSRPDNTFLFGATSDNHLGNKNSRLDVLNDLYDRFAKAKVQAVLNAGNWIDGEARFNKHELLVHGMDNQLAYLAKHYPKRKGIKTYAVAGDDHEGWYAQREGVDIGRYAEMKMQDAGRDDWINLGYMEAHIRLVNANTGASAIMAVVHPGGGSAYALSYTVQKIVESYDGGEKPAVGLYGHYHKLMAANVRNVWAVQTGCTEDQTTFMRKKKIDAHVGGVVLGLEQDPDTGAIIGCKPELIRYFVKGYYQNRWNLAGDVTHAERGR